MKAHTPLVFGLLLLCLFSSAEAQLAANPGTVSYAVSSGSTTISDVRLNNTGNMTLTDILSSLGGAIPSGWVTLPSMILSLVPNQQALVSVTLSPPSSASAGNYSGWVIFSSNEGYFTRTNISLSVSATSSTTTTITGTTTTTASTTTTTLNLDDFYKIVKSRMVNEGDYMQWGDDDEYKLEIMTVYDGKIKVRFSRYDSQISRITVNEDNIADLGSHCKVELLRTYPDTYEARINVYYDDSFKVTYYNQTTDDTTYPYTLINNQRFAAGTIIDFTNFQAKIEYVAWNGVYLTMQQSGFIYSGGIQQSSLQSTQTCLVGTTCQIYPDTVLKVESTDSQTATITVKSKQNMLVRTSGTGSSLGTGGLSTSYNTVIISLCGGKVAPGNKAIFCVSRNSFTSTNTQPITGTFILNLASAKTVDIRQGYAEVFLPMDLTCPITVTAIVDGQPTMQLISSCDQTGSTAPEIAGYSCSDGTKDGTEDGVDCGGSCPNKCKNCTDGVQNFGETGIDCGGLCDKVCDKVMTITLTNTQPYVGDTITATVRDGSTPINAAVLNIKKPDAQTTSITTDDVGTATILIDKEGDYEITAVKSGYKDQKTTIRGKGKKITIKFSPEKNYYTVGDSVSIVASDTDTGNVLASATLRANGNTLYGNYQFVQKGATVMTADATGYTQGSRSVEVRETTRVVGIGELNVGENATVTLNNPVEWKVYKGSEVITYGTGSSFTFTPTESGQYSITADGTTIGTYEAAGTNWALYIGILLIIVVILIYAIVKKGNKTRTGASSSPQKKKEAELEDILKKIKDGKTEVTTFS